MRDFKKVLDLKTLYDDDNELIYVVTQYIDNSYVIKIYSNYANVKNRYIKTIRVNNLII